MTKASPWLQFERATWPTLTKDTSAEIIIVGGGISGVMTLYYLLHHTDKKVILLEKNHIASGATGHNGGFVVGVFETPMTELIERFGREKTHRAFFDLNQSWGLLEDLLKEIQQPGALSLFEGGKLAFTSMDDFLNRIESEKLQQEFGAEKWKFMALDREDIRQKVPEKYHAEVRFVSHEELLSTLKICDPDYIACASVPSTFKAGRMNTAKLCNDMLIDLVKKFPERCSVFENTFVSQINLGLSQVELLTAQAKLQASQVILCTNAYKDFVILDQEKNLPLLKLQHEVSQVEGYMAAYIENTQEKMLGAFFNRSLGYEAVPLFYMNRAPLLGTPAQSLTVIGGPEYARENVDTQTIEETTRLTTAMYQKFLVTSFHLKKENFDYLWRGIMGYTSNKIRWVGLDPKYPQLLYNLGCNGIGVLPAVMSGKKIAAIINGESLLASIFDPI